MSEYENVFEQNIDRINNYNYIPGNYPEIINYIDESVQNYIINNDVATNITNEIVNNSNENINNYNGVYENHQYEITLILLRLASSLISNNREETITRIQNYARRLRDTFTTDEINYAISVIQLSMMSIYNTHLNNNINERNQYISSIRVILNEKVIENGAQMECPVCYCDVDCKDFAETDCQHSYCKDCVSRNIVSFNEKHCRPTCPFCRTDIKTVSVHCQDFLEDLVGQFTNI
jgi:hypothetical protein